LVVLVHGGPWLDEPWSPDLVTLRLASHGYAVLRVAYRGTIGRGRHLIEAAFGEWGGKMQTDVTDSACWAVRQGIADPHRLAVMGGSYGGYAAMEALVQTPKLFAAAVSIAGPADLVSLVDDLTTGSRSDRDHFDLYMGTDPAVRRDRSPIHHVDRIERPLLAYQGDKDEIVRPDQLRRMEQAMQSAGKHIEAHYDDFAHAVKLDPAMDMVDQGIAPFLKIHIGNIGTEPQEPAAESTEEILQYCPVAQDR
jgi:dipeptidyl aminopeptidase/acylaminoacyl peptidase